MTHYHTSNFRTPSLVGTVHTPPADKESKVVVKAKYRTPSLVGRCMHPPADFNQELQVQSEVRSGTGVSK